jgi:hypothetical protein
MSRKRRFMLAVGSGYAAIAANIINVALAIPLALRYLTREEFGLWSVVLQKTGYLSLLDLGVAQAVSRLLIDAKDDINGGIYGSILKMAFTVLCVQACIIASFGFVFGHSLSYLVSIPQNLRSTFETLVQWQCVTFSILCLATPFGDIPLWSHQRLDRSNFANIAVFAANLLFLWIGFKAGLRTFSLLLANVAGTVVYVLMVVSATTRLKLFPSRAHWGIVSWERWWEVFRFSRDLFVIRLADQLLFASQIILVSRLISLEAAAVWLVCTKSYNFAVLGAFGNRGFVSCWTGGKVSWDTWSDVAAAAYLLSSAVTRCYAGLPEMVKQIGNYKYISLLEGLLVVAGSIILAHRFHFCGVLLSSLLANLCCSGAYGAFRVSKYFNTSIADVTFGWLKGALSFLLSFVIAGLGIFWLGSRFSGLAPFLITVCSAALAGIVLAFCLGLPREIREELIQFGINLGQKIRKG